jgi:hypothetical protein
MKHTVKFAALALLVATVMFATSCGGNANKKQSADTATESATGTKADAPKKETVSGIFGQWGLTDAAVTPARATLAADASYNEANGPDNLLASATFADDAAGEAAYPGYISSLMKTLASLDDYGKPSVPDGSGSIFPKTYDAMVSEGLLPTASDPDGDASWLVSYTYGGKSVYVHIMEMGMIYMINMYSN